MNVLLTLCLLVCAVSVYCEDCSRDNPCHETMCVNSHGWWLRCMHGTCLCSHESFVGLNCTSGDVADCNNAAAHGTRCQDHGMQWHCVDNACHCSKH